MRIDRNKLDMVMANRCMTSNELQKKSGVPRGTYVNIVGGKRNVRPMTLGKIARALGVRAEEIMLEED